jgi:CheY-like chemotaxis protein
MKILVIDDSPIHRQSARQTLVGHDLTIVGTYDEAYKLLKKELADSDAVHAELGPYQPGPNEEEYLVNFGAEYNRISKKLCPPAPFDVVLSDLLMPAGKQAQGPIGKPYIGQEMPVGFALSLMAAYQGAKYVAVVTATNHHDHPASAMLDPIARDERECDCSFKRPVRFNINGATVCFFQQQPMTLAEGKDWGQVLSYLLEG